MVEIKLEDLRFAHTSKVPGCPGLEMFVATHHKSPMPACTVWYRHVHMHTMEIIDIYTHHFFRRQGVALRTLAELPTWYERVTFSTATVNAESRGLIIKSGFKQERDGWFLRPNSEEPCPAI